MSFEDKYLCMSLRQMEAICYFSNILQNSRGFESVLAGHIQSRDGYRPITRERKSLMDYEKQQKSSVNFFFTAIMKH